MSLTINKLFLQGLKRDNAVDPLEETEHCFQMLQAIMEREKNLIPLAFKGENPFKMKGNYSGKRKIDGKYYRTTYLTFNKKRIEKSKSVATIYVSNGDMESFLCKVTYGSRHYTDRNSISVIEVNGVPCLWHVFPEKSKEQESSSSDSSSLDLEEIEVHPKPPVNQKKRERAPPNTILLKGDLEDVDAEYLSSVLSSNPEIIKLAVRKAFFELEDKNLVDLIDQSQPSSVVYNKIINMMWMRKDINQKGALMEAVNELLEEKSFRRKVRGKIDQMEKEEQEAVHERIESAVRRVSDFDINDLRLKSFHFS